MILKHLGWSVVLFGSILKSNFWHVHCTQVSDSGPLGLLLISILFHTVVVHDQRVCHGLNPRSYLQGQGHNAHRENQCPGHNSLLWFVLDNISHDWCPWPNGVSLLNPRSYLQKVSIYMYTHRENWCPADNFSSEFGYYLEVTWNLLSWDFNLSYLNCCCRT